MALIPITFNADDISNEKKGKIKGQDLALALLSGMSNKVGVLDVLENPCEQYGAINVSTGYATITLHAGYIVIFGRLIYIEEGTQVQVALPQSGSVTGSFGIRINLSESGSNEVTWFTKTDLLQTDDLSKNVTTGIYEFRLYTYTATPNILSLSAFTNEKVYLMSDYLKMDTFETPAIEDNSGRLATTKFIKDFIAYNDNLNIDIELMETNIVEIAGGFFKPYATVKAFKLFNKIIIFGEIWYGGNYENVYDASGEAYSVWKIKFSNFKLTNQNYAVTITPMSSLFVDDTRNIVGATCSDKNNDSFLIHLKNVNNASDHYGCSFIAIGEVPND